MSNSGEPTAGGAIKPSARPSIHSHRGACVFRVQETVNLLTRENMVRYGWDTPGRVQNTDEGRDEVDNVMSKFARTPSPIPARRAGPKRNSVDGSPLLTSEEDYYSAKHSKSLPSMFKHHPFYSDDTEESINEGINDSVESLHGRQNRLNVSREQNSDGTWDNSPNTSNGVRALRNEIRGHQKQSPFMNSPEHFSYSNVNYPNDYRREHLSSQGSSNTKYIIGLVATLIALIVVYLPITGNELSSSNSNQYNLEKLHLDLHNIAVKHNIGDDAILQLKTAISTIVKNEDSGSFVLAYNSNKKNFDEEEFDDLINFIAFRTSKYLRNDSESVHHIVLDGSKLEVRSHSELLAKYRDDVSRNGVMLVREVDEVPSALAMAFHYYCDEFNPVAKKSAIFFTLDIAKCYTRAVDQIATHGQIEKCLRRKWSGIPPDNISPLLNRVVNTIVDVAGE